MAPFPEARLGNTDAALDQAALAVVSDPSYEAAWATLRSFAAGTGRTFLRVYGEKATVTHEATEGEHREVTISLPMPPEDSSPDQAGASAGDGEMPPAVDQEAAADADEDDDPEPITDLACWAIYGSLKALPPSGVVADEATTAGQSVDVAAPSPARRSPFELEREAVTAALDGFTPGPESPFWSMLARAQAAGFVDEAIYLHLLDESLVGEYRTFRDAHADRLVDYLLTVVAPARQR